MKFVVLLILTSWAAPVHLVGFDQRSCEEAAAKIRDSYASLTPRGGSASAICVEHFKKRD